jgi:NAD+ kinase
MKQTEKKFARVGIVFRNESPPAKKLAKQAAAWLKKKGIQVFSHPKQTIAPGITKINHRVVKTLDFILVLGGDGTYLEAVRLSQGERIPILGVNMGSLGFLTFAPKETLYEHLEATLEGRMEHRRRAMLDVRVKRKGKIVGHYQALNDVVIERGLTSQLINISVYSDKYPVIELKADGLVVASPTGSTAYNLAAGGPVLHPHSKAIVATPICAHSLTHRPIILPDDQDLMFRVQNKNHKARITIDGQAEGELSFGDEVIVKRSKNDHFMIRAPSHNYFDLLRTKLKFGER